MLLLVLVLLLWPGRFEAATFKVGRRPPPPPAAAHAQPDQQHCDMSGWTGGRQAVGKNINSARQSYCACQLGVFGSTSPLEVLRCWHDSVQAPYSHA